jgi:DtxR family transcriptional regulator, Mn-dependent transcriptional regulator
MSSSTEEYLEAIYNIVQDGKTATTSAISKRLNISAASVTEMLRRLADDNYVNYAPYQGVTLTPRGLSIGQRMTRKHRLLERFLHDTLKIGNDKVHAEACAMEHTLSDEAERALCQTLKVPDKCPDDEKPIPPCNLAFTSCQECKESGMTDFKMVPRRKENIVALSSLKEKQAGTVAFIRGENKIIRRLCDMGLTPGTKISIDRIAPLRGPVEVTVRGRQLALGDEIVCNVFVEKPSESRNENRL